MCTCVGFSLKNRERKEGGKYIRKTTIDRVFVIFHFSRCNIDGRGKVLKLLRNVWKEVIFKNQKIVQTTSSLVLYVVV